MKNVLAKLVDASFQLGYHLVATKFTIEKIVVSKDAIVNIHGDRLRFQEPMAEFGIGKVKICDIPIELDNNQTDDFKFIVSMKKGKAK